MRTCKYLAHMILLLFFFSCDDADKILAPAYKAKLKDHRVNPVFAGEVEPPIPNHKENNKTLLGIDSNNNGLRDDIDIWINRTGKSNNEIMALRQLAKALREQSIVGNMAYENFKKGPINTENDVEREYNRSISKLVESTKSLEADATACHRYIYNSAFYNYDEIEKIDSILYIFYKSSELRTSAIESFYKYNHVYHTSKYFKEDYDYCGFGLENFELTKKNHLNYLNKKREKIGIKQ